MVGQMPIVQAVFDAELVRCVDADTLIVRLSKHHGDYSDKTLRLLGIDAPETRGVDKERGLAAQAFVEEFLLNGGIVYESLIVHTTKMDGFGRWLAYVWRKADGASLGDALREAGHAHAVSVIAQMKEAKEE